MERFIPLDTENMALLRNAALFACLEQDFSGEKAEKSGHFSDKVDAHRFLGKVEAFIDMKKGGIKVTTTETPIAIRELRRYADFVRDSGMTSNDIREFAASINALIELIKGGTEK